MYKARIKRYRQQPQTVFFILLSFSIHRPQNLGSPTPAVTFNWCRLKTQIASMVMCRPDPALHMVRPGESETCKTIIDANDIMALC